jgi:flagellin-like hook-associated protein FlgL
MSRDDRVAVAKNMEGMRDNLYSLMNTQIDDEFIFAGSNTEIKSYEKDKDFKINGQIDFNGNGHLRNIAVEPNTYRERGVSAYDVLMYNTDTSEVDGTISFTQHETVLDEYGNTWKFINYDNINEDTDKAEGAVKEDRLYKINEDGTVSKYIDSLGNEHYEYMEIKSVAHDPQEFQIKGTVVKDEKFHIKINLEDGTVLDYHYSANDGDTAEDVALAIKDKINSDLSPKMTATTDGKGNIQYETNQQFTFELDPPEFQIKNTVSENEEFKLKLNFEDGTSFEYTYTAQAGDTSEDVALAIKDKINDELDNSVMVADTDGEGNITYTTNQKFKYELDPSIDSAIFVSPEGKYTTETINDAKTNNHIGDITGSGLLLETKHNIFDDLNIMINSLYGYSTLSIDGYNGYKHERYGQKDQIINDEEVRAILADSLERMSNQFDATNVGHAELGGRNRIFVNALDTINSKVTHYNILLQETNGADMGKLAMESKALELTYNALYSTVAKMNQLSLVNFLK